MGLPGCFAVAVPQQVLLPLGLPVAPDTFGGADLCEANGYGAQVSCEGDASVPARP